MRIVDSLRGVGESMRKIIEAVEENKKRIICKDDKEKNKLLHYAKMMNAKIEIITRKELRSKNK